MRLRRTLAAAASALLLPTLAQGAGASAPDLPALPIANDVAPPDTYVAIPILRQAQHGPVPFLYVVRPAGFGLTVEDLRNAGLTVVPESVSVRDVAGQAIDVDVVARRIADLVGAKRSASGASAADAESASAAAMTTLSNVPIAVYSDASNTAVGHSIANTAWTEARDVLSSQTGVTFDVVTKQDNATAYPPGQPAVSDVKTECDLQRFSEYEESIGRNVRAQAVLVFSDGDITPFGSSTGHRGLAMGKPPWESLDVSTRWNRGSSRDACRSVPNGAEYRRSPAYVPAAFASTLWNAHLRTEKQSSSHWAAHEVGHMFTMTHDMADCRVNGGVMHKSLEAATSAQPTHCAEYGDFSSYYRYYFSAAGEAAIEAENARRSACIAASWCTSNATPSATRYLSAQPENGSVLLSWDAPLYNGGNAIAGYCIHRSSVDNFVEGPNTQQQCQAGTSTSYRWTGLTNGETSYYYVRAYNMNDDPSTPWGSTPYDREGPASNYIGVAPGTVPGAPTLNPITPGNGQLSLSWSPPANNGGYPITYYRIYRTCSICTPSNWTTTNTSFTDGNLTNGVTYNYRVAALNIHGEGAQSNERSEYPRTVPGAPTLNSATPGNATVSLAWTAPSSNGGAAISGYRVFRASTSTGTRTQLTSGGCGGTVTTTSCTDDTVTNGTVYWYDVRAVNVAGTSNASNVLSAQPTQPPTGSFTEGWESGTSAWSITGTSATQDCSSTPVLTGCSLKFQPTASSGLTVSRATAVPLTTTSTASFWFRGSSTTGDTDTAVSYAFNTGGSLTLSLTDGITANNGMNLNGPSNSTGVFYSWPSANTWYQAVVTMNATTDVATVQVKNTSGTVVGSSSTSVTIPGAATSIINVTMSGNAWNLTQNAFHFDSISVTGSGPFSESWDNGTSSWSITGTQATHDCTSTPVLAGCSLKFQPTSSSGLAVQRAISVPMSSTTTASFWFRGNSTTGDTDSAVSFAFNTGGSLTLSLTDGVSSNNGMNLNGPSNSTGVFYNWPSASTWYQAVVTINPSTDVATVQVKNTSGSVVGSSSTNVWIPSSATSITNVGIHGNAWNGTQNAFNVDSIAIG